MRPPAIPTEKTIDVFKSWIFPSLVSVMGMMVWSTVTETQADVKMLLQVNATNTNAIQNNSERIDRMESRLFNKTSAESISLGPFKHEEELDIKKFLRIL